MKKIQRVELVQGKCQLVKIPKENVLETRIVSESNDHIDKKNNLAFSSSESLRAKLELLQKVRSELGIESHAAAEPGTILTYALITFFTGLFAHSIVTLINEKIVKPLGKHWNDNLLTSNPEDRKKAIDELVNATDITNPQMTTQNLEFALREILMESLDSSGMKLENLKNVVAGVCNALEALYQREDAGSNAVYMDDKMRHGWQDHSIIISALSQVTEAGEGIFKNVLNPPKAVKVAKIAYDKNRITNEVWWHDQNDACKALSTLLLHHTKLNEDDAFPAISERAVDSLARILVRNWKVPVEYKTPPTTSPIDYRTRIYNTLYQAVVNPLGFIGLDMSNVPLPDPLFLRKNSVVPFNLQKPVEELRTALVKAYRGERQLVGVSGANNPSTVVAILEKILDQSTAISRIEWDPEEKNRQGQIVQDNQKLDGFKQWALDIPGTSGTELEKCFQKLSDTQRPNIVMLNTLLKTRDYVSLADLNIKFRSVVDFMNIAPKPGGERLVQESTGKGIFFFRYLNTLMETKVRVSNGTVSSFKDHLDRENIKFLLDATALVIHDSVNFPAERNIDFFTTPLLTSIPGQALALHRKLAPGFSENGYLDVHGIKDVVLSNAVDILSGTAIERGFILSCPPEIDRLSLVKALANQLAVNFFQINRSMVQSRAIESRGQNEFDVTVELPSGSIGTLGDFTTYVTKNNPCVLFFDNAEKLLVPRPDDEGRDTSKEPSKMEEDLTNKFLSHLDTLHAAPRVILTMMTNQPPSNEIDLASLDNNGYSDRAKQILYKHVSFAGIRGGRVDYKSFLLHKPLTEKRVRVEGEGEIEKLKSYIRDKVSNLLKIGGKQLNMVLNYSELAEAALELELNPKLIKRALEELTPFVLTQENILDAFKAVKKI